MDLLPKHMCHRCSYKLEEFHKFYVDCLKTDTTLKNQLSWMQKGHGSGREKNSVPMVHIENVNIKTEPLDYDVYELEPIVDNIDYINSMANSVTFPADCIRDGLTYAAFSRYRCCCDKDQSRRRSKLCRNYEGSVSRCTEIANNSRRRAALEDACVRLKSAKRKAAFACALQNRPRDRPSCLDTVEEARVRLTSAEAEDTPSQDTRNRSHSSKYVAVAETSLQTADFSSSTVVRNLRPRKNLINYALNKKPMLNVQGPSTKNKTNRANSSVNPASGLELTRQIKVEQLDELEGRTLRPRMNVVNYYGPKKKSTASESARREQRKKSELPRCAKRSKLDDVSRSSKLQSKDKDTPNELKLRIKQETPDDLNDVMLDETTNVMSALANNHAKVADLPATVTALASNASVNLRDSVSYLGSNRLQPDDKFQLIKDKSIVATSTKNRSVRSKKVGRFIRNNYASKCLRSQNTYLRNGKVRRYDYVKWSVKKLHPKNLIDAVAKNAKKVPAMLKLAESIKHYCETCNVSFMNMELFRLHVCYYD
ncbi:uncharacterized protein LOC105185364 isoform X2 [Harpegnathos saltator]|nr:uncharacterized protein LOC105185364 isoform X2 [Harpegnathos saltator]